MDFSKMDGYEFERFISALFKYMGFSVEETSYSQDGGIDLIAICEKPIFSGKYIIQCKNWQGYVGAPEVRDLYGVVMDQRANKGILISTSDFTSQAYSFAEGKNIELINGIELQKLLNTDNKKNETKDFSEMPKNFNQERYLYLKNHIETEPRSSKYYDEMVSFLKEYMIDKEKNAIFNNILELLIKYTEDLIKKCYKAKSKEIYKKTEELNIAMYYMLLGQIDKTLEIVLDKDMFLRYESVKEKRYARDFFIKASFANDFLTRNLYVIFEQIGYENGMSLIEHMKSTPFGKEMYLLKEVAIPYISKYQLWLGSSRLYCMNYRVYKNSISNELLIRMSDTEIKTHAIKYVPGSLLVNNMTEQEKIDMKRRMDKVFVQHGML